MPRGGKIPSIGSYVFIITESCVPLVTDFSVVLFTDNNDVLVVCEDYVLAYQVKDLAEKFTYNSLLNEKENLLIGSFKDYSILKSKYPNKEIKAFYISNQKPSSHDKIKIHGGLKKANFKRFKTEFWDKINDSSISIDSISSEWKPVIEELRNVLKSDDNDLENFIKSFSFLFDDDYKVFKDTEFVNNQVRIQDVEKISRQIFSLIGRKGNVYLDKYQVLKEFDLLSRYETHFKHSFFVDDDHYQPIQNTISDLESLLDKVQGGYIALIGNAGSGKSTLLTKWMNGRNENILKYYAYVNEEMNNEFGYRGEANIFLKDLLIQIREKDLSVYESLPVDDLMELQRQLHKELESLSREDKKTFIIVDGLDHIEREQSVNRSLVDILPNPEQIPQNIYFILGTRTTQNLEELPDRIKINLNKESRVVNITPLSLLQVKSLLTSHNLHLDSSHVSALHANTLGHPLFLRYTIEEIKGSDESEYEKLISQKDFKGDIYSEYKIFWNSNKDEDEFIDLLGVISRFRYSSIDLNLLSQFVTNRKSGEKVKKLLEHYFFKQGGIWQFFHNSFKEFLKEETAKNILTNEYQEQRNRGYHIKIYEVIKGIQDTNHYKPNTLYHLFEAREFSKVVELGNQCFFRKQWFDFRNYNYIFEDIKLVALAAYHVNDPIRLFDCFICCTELSQRVDNFHLSNYTKIFLSLGLISLSNSFIFDQTEVHVSNGKLLEYALEVYEKGYKELAFSLLKKGEPNYLLDISKKVSPNRINRNEIYEVDEISVVINWVKLASLYEDVDLVLERIKYVEVEFEEHRPKSVNRDLLIEALDSLTDLYINLKDWDKLRQIEPYYRSIDKYHQFFFYFDIVWELPNEDKLFRSSQKIIENWKESDSNPINKRLALYHVFKKGDLERGNAFFELLEEPKEIEKTRGFDRFDEGFLNYIFDYSRLYYIINIHFENEPYFTPVETKDHLTNYFKEFAYLGRDFAYLHNGSKEAAMGFRFRFKTIMQYFHFSVTDYEYEYSIIQNKSSMVNLILGISSKISKEYFDEMLKELESEWNGFQRYWGISARQNVIDFVLETEINESWCEEQLNKLDNKIFERDDISTRIESGIAQIELWTKLKKLDKGKDILDSLMKLSVDVRWEKDNQLESIINWLSKLSGDRSQEYETFLKSLESIDGSTSHSAKSLAKEILQYALSKGNGFEVFKFLVLEGYINFTDSLEYYLVQFLGISDNSSSLIKIFTRLILNNDEMGYRNDFIKKLFSLKPSSETIKILVDEVKIYSVYERRKDYLVSISEYAEKIGINSTDLDISMTSKQEGNQSSRSELKLKGNKKMEYSEVLKKIVSKKDIHDLIEKEDKANSYFNWSKIILEKLDLIDDEEIELFLDKVDFKFDELSDLAEGLNEKTRKITTVLDQLYKKISNASNYDWSWEYSGGRKQKVFNQLLKLDDQKKVRQLAFKDLASGINLSNSRLLSHIDEIFKIIDPKFSYDIYYPCLKEYKDLILDIHQSDAKIPRILGDFSENDLFKSLIMFLIEIPSRFDDTIFEILLEDFVSNRDFIEILVDTLFEKREYFKSAKLLAGISIIDTGGLTKYKDEIIELINNDRYDIHRIGCRIMERMGQNYSPFYQPKTKKQPFIYSIDIPYNPELILKDSERMDRIKQTGHLRKTDDPIEYCNLYITDIKEVSKHCGIEVINLTTRIKEIGKQYYQLPDWLEGLSEEEIRKIYKHRLELKIAYNRPRYQKVWGGFMVVLKELFELDLISKELSDFISNEFDERTYFVRPVEQPSFIPSIIGSKERDYAPSTDKDWAYDLSDEYLDKTLKCKGANELFILAENSIIDGQGDGATTEIRQAFVALDERFDIKNNHTIFDLTMKANIEDYPSLNEGYSISLYNWILQIGKKRNWLAINPSLARAMGLVLSEQGNFRWVDEKGNIIVESIYWRNNDNQNRSRNLHSESGHGWYVVINNEGINRMKTIGIKQLFHHKKIFRSIDFIQRRYNTYISENHDHWDITKIEI